mgnify:CR=1 FL=1
MVIVSQKHMIFLSIVNELMINCVTIVQDKWRNMNVGICGHTLREKLPKAFPKLLLLTGGESVGVPSGEFSSEEAPGAADALVSDSSKDRKVLDPR